MANVVSHGLSKPTALRYLVDEGLLAADAPRNSYTWQVVSNEDNGDFGDDELLTTKTCVVWSRGGLVRKSFRFESEKEPVEQALLTYFAIDQSTHLSTENFQEDQEHQRQRNRPRLSNRRSKALVVFLQTQAHIYFLSGSSHVIHLPFEVECAIAAPNGLIIQRRLQAPSSGSPSLKFPRAPRGSFVSTQTLPWSGKSSQGSTRFSIAALGSPQQLPMMTLPLLGDLWGNPKERSDASWPRLFSLTDPLMELGLVVAGIADPGNGYPASQKKESHSIDSLSPSEEILYVSSSNDWAPTSQPAVEFPILAVTFNRDICKYTVWKFTYEKPKSASQELAAKEKSNSNPPSRRKSRRSSFAPGGGTGATTPVTAGPLSLRESFGGTSAILGTKPMEATEELDAKVHFESALDADFENMGVPRRQSRRVSSRVARADLSLSHEPSFYAELAAGHQNAPARRGPSIGSQYNRNSTGGALFNGQTSFSNVQNKSLNSHADEPVNNDLEELQASGDIGGFLHMGLDDEDFEGLHKEVVLTKIKSVAAQHSHVRFPSRHQTASSQCKIFMLSAPHSTTEEKVKEAIVICILDPSEKKLLIMRLNTQRRTKPGGDEKHPAPDKQVISVSWARETTADGVLDACKLNDGDVSRMLVLSETADGFGDLTLQAPWSELIRISLPGELTMHHFRSLGNDVTPTSRPRENGLKRVLTRGPRALVGLQNPMTEGVVDVLDDEGRLHQLQITMRPRNTQVLQVLSVCQLVLLGDHGGEGIIVGWWNVKQWLKQESVDVMDAEYSALVIILFVVTLSLCPSTVARKKLPLQQRSSRGRLTRSTSSVQADAESWGAMMSQEARFGGLKSPWIQSNGWNWISSEEDTPIPHSKNNVILRHVALARDFVASPLGQHAIGPDGYLPTSSGKRLDRRQAALSDLLSSLHLLHEEQKLHITLVDSVSMGLTPIIAQMCKWLGWHDWSEAYDVEGEAMDGDALDNASHATKGPRQPSLPYPIYEWIQQSLILRTKMPFTTLGDIIKRPSVATNELAPSNAWTRLTARTAIFARFFALLRPDMTSPEFVEAMLSAGIDNLTLETLPEAISAPMHEAIADCQAEPPASWTENLLRMVGRDDLNNLAEEGKVATSLTSLVPLHESNLDVHIICSTAAEPENIGFSDGSADVDRQTVTRLIFKDDRRFREASKILNTSRPTIAYIAAEPDWTESDLLEAQKEHVQMLAIRTLAIPAGRGLLNYSARVPLLTEKFPIGGFNLHCVFKPTSNTIGVEKSAFTEEKVCWAFFHAGVSAGLSISRQAKGVDTSWIMYNKPQELTNRHAGFLLGLGLNGHLKSLAKWVAFKYLTPKHAMTSIGLLLGLAASYIGTMDSLVTRLLSVHVTRMLPPGAAELNLLPLTQATGIMGIGLLYCNTQHRRMSEIMLSEMEYAHQEIEDEPLRNEAYRLSAGFALGFINLGKGSDLKGLHDMHLTERLLALAVGNKKVNIVHVLDKATAAAVISIALIFMKSEDEALAQKVDVPDSALQFDYIRPDTFMLRTLAKHLILWNKIEASMSWVKRNLPEMYRRRADLTTIEFLSSDDLPLYDIVSGLCFSIALRFAGSGSIVVRDLVVHYLDQLMRICRLPASNYDQRLTQSTVRNCQDLLALCTATIMAGTGDLTVLRRLRSMHGRDDSDTPYGSHLAAHLAIGALFLAGGTYTFGTSTIAIGALLVAFYPIFPTTILDNNSHLQAFRHFWVLAAEPRCLVARDFETNLPVSVPLSVALRNGEHMMQHTPCLLPELKNISRINTQSPEYWNVMLDLENNTSHVAAFQANQSVSIRRRPAHDASTSVFQATLQALGDRDGTIRQPLEWLFDLPAFTNLTKAERALVLPPESSNGDALHTGSQGNVVDARLVLENASLNSGKRDRLLGLRLLFDWVDQQERKGRPTKWIRGEVVEALKASAWMMSSAIEDE